MRISEIGRASTLYAELENVRKQISMINQFEGATDFKLRLTNGHSFLDLEGPTKRTPIDAQALRIVVLEQLQHVEAAVEQDLRALGISIDE